MVDIASEAVRLYRTARETRQDADYWRVGHYAYQELIRFYSASSCTLAVRGADEMNFMGLPVVVDGDLPERRITLRAGLNTVGAFAV